MNGERWPTRLTWFRFFPDDYAGGTQLFTVPEHGQYILLLRAQWASKDEQAIPADAVSVILQGTKPTRRVLAKFERVNGNALRNSRLCQEWEHAKSMHEHAVGAARARFGHASGMARAHAQGHATQTQTQTKETQTKETQTKDPDPDDALSRVGARRAEQGILPQLRNPVLAQWRLWQRLTSRSKQPDDKLPLGKFTEKHTERRLNEYGEARLALIVLLGSKDEWLVGHGGFQTLMRNQPVLRRGEPAEERMDQAAKFSEQLGQANAIYEQDIVALRAEGFESAIEYAHSRGWRIIE